MGFYWKMVILCINWAHGRANRRAEIDHHGGASVPKRALIGVPGGVVGVSLVP